MRFLKFSAPMQERRLAKWAKGENDFIKVGPECSRGHSNVRRTETLSVVLPKPPVPDVVWTWYSEPLVKTHVLSFMREKGLTGFTAKEARARSEDGTASGTFFELVTVGWGGVAPPDSGVRLIEPECPICHQQAYSPFTDATKIVDSSQWDGSDFFMVWPYTGFRIVTERFVQLMQSQEFSGLRFLDLATLRPASETTPVRTGRLSEFFPEARARELAARHGLVA